MKWAGGKGRLVPVGGGLIGLSHWALGAADVGRLRWSPPVPPAVQIPRLVLFGLGMALAIWAVAVNRFFSPVVRIQEERGHHLIREGPYAIVRHPGYASALLSLTASGPAMGSWWSVVPAVALNLLIVRRVILEDRFLHGHLEGYPKYAAEVRHRIIPGVW